MFIYMAHSLSDWMDIYNGLSDLRAWLNVHNCEHCDTKTQLGLNPHVHTVWSSAVGFITDSIHSVPGECYESFKQNFIVHLVL